MDERTMAGATLATRLASNSALRLAVFTSISTLVVTFAIGYFFQSSIYSKDRHSEDVTYANLFWLKIVAGPLAISTALGVLSSRARHCRNIPPAKTIITVAVTPFVALCTFLAAYLILLSFHSGDYNAEIYQFRFRVGLLLGSNHRAMVCASCLRPQEAFVS